MPIRNEIQGKQQIRMDLLMRLTKHAGHYRKVTENFLEAIKRMFPRNMPTLTTLMTL